MMRLKQLALWLAPWRSVLLASNVGVSGQDWGRNGRAERSIMLPLCRGRWMGLLQHIVYMCVNTGVQLGLTESVDDYTAAQTCSVEGLSMGLHVKVKALVLIHHSCLVWYEWKVIQFKPTFMLMLARIDGCLPRGL
eukprot:scaffold6723_cov19-Tisochrysis_lutea.AAC.1